MLTARVSREARRVLGITSTVAESAVLQRRWRSTQPQLFILGLPRSGTTLVYQYVVHRFRVAYFTNGVGRLACAPCLTSYLQHVLHRRYVSDFESRYGKVRGAVAPREAGAFWGRFFDLDEYSEPESVDRKTAETLRREIMCIQRAFGDQPFVNKNVKHMLWLRCLASIFPDPYFLVVERERRAVALSVLEGRKTHAPAPETWWSVRPPEYDDLRTRTLPEQVAGQIVGLEERLQRDLETLPAGQVLRIQYEAFCRSPEMLTDLLSDILGTERRNGPAGPFKVREREAEHPDELLVSHLLEEHRRLDAP